MFYDITYVCGHTGRIQLYGSAKEREYRAAHEAKKLCHACFVSQQLHDAQEITEGMNLPDLRGSEKQVVWATQLRAKMLLAYKNTTIPTQLSEAIEFLVHHMVNTQTESAWWIERRDVVEDVAKMTHDYMTKNPDVETIAKKYIHS